MRAAVRLADSYLGTIGVLVTDGLVPELTDAERVEMVFHLFKFRIGSLTRIALGLDPETMGILEK